MSNEPQKDQSFEKKQVPPSMPEDKKEFKKDVKQKKIEGDEDLGDACGSKGGSCGSGIDSEDEE